MKALPGRCWSGRTEVINRRIKELGLAMVKDRDFEVINPVKDRPLPGTG